MFGGLVKYFLNNSFNCLIRGFVDYFVGRFSDSLVGLLFGILVGGLFG